MGRKIKGCKHHGTKDPEKQRQNRENLVKMKVEEIIIFIFILKGEKLKLRLQSL